MVEMLPMRTENNCFFREMRKLLTFFSYKICFLGLLRPPECKKKALIYPIQTVWTVHYGTGSNELHLCGWEWGWPVGKIYRFLMEGTLKWWLRCMWEGIFGMGITDN